MQKLKGKNMVYELIGYNTDQRYNDVRYREYTISKKKAELFSQIPKIQFTDSGHGIVFSARPHKGKKKPRVTVLLDYVEENLSKLRKAKQAKVEVERSKEFLSLVLFLETQLVDYGGLVATKHMNAEDMNITKEMEKEGLITFKRLPGDYVFDQERNSRGVTHRVEFSEKMWEIAHKERRNRAERLVLKSKLWTGG